MRWAYIKAIDGTAAGEIVTSLLSFITAPTSALILIVMGYQLHVSKKLLRPVLTTMGLRLGRAGGRLRGGFGHSVCHHSV